MKNRAVHFGSLTILPTNEYYCLHNEMMSLRKEFEEFKDRNRNHRSYSDRCHDMRWTMDIVDLGENPKEQIDIIDFLVKAIRNDVKYDYLTKMIYYGKSETFAFNLIPEKIEIGKGRKINAVTETKRIVSLKDHVVLTIPEEAGKLKDRIVKQKDVPFVYTKGKQKAEYYQPLGICTVVNGRHSIAAGVIYEKGEIEARIIDMSLLFKYMRFDGSNWINTKTDEKISEAQDFRVGLIYELARKKYELLKRIK